MSVPASLPASDAVAPAALRPDALRALEALDPTGGNGFVERVLSTYLRSVGAQLQGLQGARETADSVTAVRLVHSLKSSSSYVGAETFAQFCAQVEEQMKACEKVQQGASLTDPVIVAGLDELAARAPQVCSLVSAELAKRQTER